MKKVLLFLIMLLTQQIDGQTWVTIPDSNFVIQLQSIVPSAMNGNQMNINDPVVTTNTHRIDVSWRNISNLFGIQYFTSLSKLFCQGNSLSSLPPLPNTLSTLICASNNLTSLPTLPTSLDSLNCADNSLTTLPSLPNSLIYLFCRSNHLSTLPVLPNTFRELDCSSNLLTTLNQLPDSLISLTCYDDSLICLPPLPGKLTNLNCCGNKLTSLPVLPNTLLMLFCCENKLIGLPVLPDSLKTLYCYNNNISCFPTFPNSIQPNITGGGTLIVNFAIYGNPFSCIPDITAATSSGYWQLNYSSIPPICNAGNPSSCASNYSCIAGIEKYQAKDEIVIYPNPANDLFYIDANTTDKLKVDLYDVNGRHVFSTSVMKKENINVATLDNGAYTLTIKTSDRVINNKLFILR